MRKSPVVIGVAGGTGSGKTTVAQVILERVGAHRITFLPQDAYYKDLSALPPAQRALMNFDHPDALEMDLMVEQLQKLRNWEPIEMPVYDFTTHTRKSETQRVEPNPVVLVEGILVLADPRLRELMDVKLYVDTDADVRFIRRLSRDIAERGRTMESVINQYMTTVRPMHLEFVEPTKRYADVIIPEGGFNQVAMDMVVARLGELLDS
ncbi:MAG: uridine kinase [Anaerolineae bacterium]